MLGLVILLWWLFFSRAAWFERIGAIVVMVASVFLMFRVVHPSVSNGMMGGMLPVFSIPLLCLGLVGWAAISHRLPGALRFPALVVALALALAAMTLVRTDGISSAGSQLHWRWTPSAEDRLLARGDDPVAPLPAPVVAEAPKEPASVACGGCAQSDPCRHRSA